MNLPFNRSKRVIAVLLLLFAAGYGSFSCGHSSAQPFPECTYDSVSNTWTPADAALLPDTGRGALIAYGRDLFIRTSYFFGPNGKIASLSNGMNCQNCHLDAGARSFSNCLSAAASSYPGFRPRSGKVETLIFRVNDCMQRSMNGDPIDSSSKEMQAIVAYLRWLGNAVPMKVRPIGAGLPVLAYLNRAADTLKGKYVFESRCVRCHGANGEGQPRPDGTGYIYPPLWGNNSFNDASGMLRVSRLAGFVKYSMPFDSAKYEKPSLTDEDAWDVAAYVSSRPRPAKNFQGDWPDIAKKPVDHPFGPYADQFTTVQHKYGPFTSMKEPQKQVQKK